MNAIRLVAWREYKQYVTTRGFWLGILLFPLGLVIAGSVPQLLAESQPRRHFVLVDQSGAFEGGVAQAFEDAHRRRVAMALAAYLQVVVKPEALENDLVDRALLRPGDEAVAAIKAQGGLEATLAGLAGYLREEAPAFTPPRRLFIQVALPPEIDRRAPIADIAQELGPYLRGSRPIRTDEGDVDLFAAVLVPADAARQDGERPAIQFWSTNISDRELQEQLSRAFDTRLRQAEYARRGLDSEEIRAIETITAPVLNFDPSKMSGDEEIGRKDLLEQIIPFAMAYMLWVGIFTVANILLTNVVEEKSNKIIEVLLSSVTAHELMIGKLLGVLGLGMTTIFFWLLTIVLAIGAFPGATSSIAGPIVDLLFSTPLLIAFIAYFLVAYLIFAAIFMAIGSMCSSLSDAQTYMGPLMILLIVPLIMLSFIFRDPNGTLASFMSWIPIYTPYVMMMRVSADPPLLEFIGANLVMVATAIIVLWLMGRVFRRSILRTGQPPRFGEVIRLLRSRQD